jgi:hypothetical protein
LLLLAHPSLLLLLLVQVLLLGVWQRWAEVRQMPAAAAAVDASQHGAPAAAAAAGHPAGAAAAAMH